MLASLSASVVSLEHIAYQPHHASLECSYVNICLCAAWTCSDYDQGTLIERFCLTSTMRIRQPRSWMYGESKDRDWKISKQPAHPRSMQYRSEEKSLS